MEDVKMAVFDSGALKAPGPDGFSGTFYQHHWETVLEVIHQSAHHHQSISNLIRNLNQTHIALIPKMIPPTEPVHFRPIALCNFSYKILSKIIATRLKVFMPELITSNQSAFVNERLIQDNIMVAHEVYHHLKLQKSDEEGVFGLKLDMNKAYDRVEWSFLEKVLQKLGFSDSWVKLVMSCVTSVNYSIILNGKPGPWFTLLVVSDRNSASKGVHWKACDRLGLPKAEGGLGFRNFQEFNDALLAKQVWRLHQFPYSISAQVIKQLYHASTSILEAKKGGSPSWLWASLLGGRDFIKSGSCWDIGNGDSVNLWFDSWIPGPSPSPLNVGNDPLQTKVSSMIN
ncbi:hypothetical protein ACLB2K_041458 [Fragaria x ananassa]